MKQTILTHLCLCLLMHLFLFIYLILSRFIYAFISVFVQEFLFVNFHLCIALFVCSECISSLVSFC